jgi:hypothetical protein
MDDGFFSYLVSLNGLDPAAVLAQYDSGGPERMLDLSIRTGPWGDRYGENPDGITLQTFKDNPDGLDFGPMVPRVRDLLRTPSGKIELAPAYILADIPRLVERLDRPSDTLVMTSRRHLRSNNSWMHQVSTLVGGTNRCTLLINPADAAAAGVSDGDLVCVKSEAGQVDVEAEVSDEGVRAGEATDRHHRELGRELIRSRRGGARRRCDPGVAAGVFLKECQHLRRRFAGAEAAHPTPGESAGSRQFRGRTRPHLRRPTGRHLRSPTGRHLSRPTSRYLSRRLTRPAPGSLGEITTAGGGLEPLGELTACLGRTTGRRKIAAQLVSDIGRQLSKELAELGL